MAVRTPTMGRATGPLISPRLQRQFARLAGYAAIILLCVAITAPMFWMLTGAFKMRPDFLPFPPIWLPELLRWTSWADVTGAWVNFQDAWAAAPFERWYFNSIVITLCGMALELTNATMTAYALAFLRFPYK